MLKISNHSLFWQKIYNHLIKDECNLRASSLAFTTLISLVPMAVISLRILSAFPVFNTTKEELKNFIVQHFMTSAAQTLQHHIEIFVNQANQLPITSIISFIISAFMMIFNVESAFNTIWHVFKRRKFAHKLLFYFGLLSIIPPLFALNIILIIYFNKLSSALPLAGMGKHYLINLLSFLSLSAFLVIPLTTFYKLIPNTTVKYKDALVGALIASILFNLFNHLMSLYFNYFPTYQLIYGALVAIPILLIWIYGFWFAVLFGGVASYCHSLKNR